MSANERQVGGTHYNAGYIHWDWVLAIGMGYLEGNATKYIIRHKKKGNPVQDLEKGLHYIEKTIECLPICIVQVKWMRPPLAFIRTETGRFVRENDVDDSRVQQVLYRLAEWTTADDLRGSADMVRQLLSLYPVAPAKSVPLEDSNKHADRFSKLSNAGD